MIYFKNEAFRDTSQHQVIYTMPKEYHEQLRFLNKLYFNKIFSLNFIKMGNNTFISIRFLKISLVSSYSLKQWIYYTAQDKSNVSMFKFLNEQ